MTTPATDTEALLANAAWVHRLARRLLRDADAADDAAQDALAAALARPGGFDGHAGLRRWLASVLRRLAARARRRASEQRAREARAARREATDGGFEALERVRLRQRLVEAVLALDEPYRQAIVLRFFEELPPRTIARRLGVSSDAVRQRVARGLARLRARLDRETAGGREAWATALLPLARAGTTREGILAAEGVLVGTKVATTVAAALALAAGTWVWRERPRAARTAPVTVERAVGTGATARGVVHEQTSLPASLPARAPARAAALDEETEVALVRVVDPRGDPLPDARLVRLDARGEAVALAVDGTGRARAKLPSDPAYVAARAPGHGVASAAFAPDAREITLVLPLAVALEGTLLEDGRVPPEPLVLEVRTNGEALEGVPSSLHTAALRALFLESEPRVRTDAGRFRVEGLRTGWSGELRLPQTHAFVEAPAGASLAPPRCETVLLPHAGDWNLAITRLPGLRGRLVWQDDGRPVEQAVLEVYATFSDGSPSPLTGFAAGPDGHFAIGLMDGSSSATFRQRERRPSIVRARLDVYPEGGPPRSFGFSEDTFPVDGDVGTLRLERGRSLHFVVRDEAGRPVAGAYACASAASAPTDENGRGMLAGLPLAPADVRFGAHGRRILRQTVADGTTESEPLVVTLPPGNTLALRVVDRDGKAPRGLGLVLECTGPLFESATGLGPSPFHYAVFGDTVGGGYWDDDHGYSWIELDEDGCAELSGLNDDVALTAQLRDWLGRVLLEERFPGPGGGERLERTIVVDAEPFTLTGRVTDEAGRPLPNVSIVISGLGARSKTGSDGTFAIADLYPCNEARTATIALGGWVTRVLDGVVLEPGRDLGTITLSRGRTVGIEVVDAASRFVAGAGVQVSSPGAPIIHGSELEPGRFRVEDASLDACTVNVVHGCRGFEHTLGRGETSARYVLPVHGSLELLAPDDVPVFEDGTLVAHLVDLADPSFDVSYPFVDGESRSIGVQPLLPGRYRVTLEHGWWEQDEQRTDVLGGPWELEVRAGEHLRRRLGEE